MTGCREVRRGFEGCIDLVTVLLGIVLLPSLRYSTERLSMIARAVGLVSSGAGVERRKLVSMLTDFKIGCTEEPLDVDPKLLFCKFEQLDQCSLLSVGFAHGVAVVGSRDAIRDQLTSHLINGVCADSSGSNHPLCVAVVGKYMKDLRTRDKDILCIRLLESVCPYVKTRSLKRILRLLDVTFDTSCKIVQLRQHLCSYVDHLRRECERQNVIHSTWPSLITDLQKVEIVRRFRDATSSDALRTFVCASCSARHNCGNRVSVDISQLDLALLKRPDC
ncbi:hypothetical protein EV363DRAFT_1183433 [Boletus edulis]|nr:hypothetical protein EV363DRAFT_1183433 [Boletus edulis]